ncbi:MAG: hypothetical protein ACMV0Y_12400 [Paludibacter sp.]
MSEINKRIQTVIHEFALSRADFCNSTGIYQIEMKQIFKKEREVTYNHIYLICRAYPELNTDWLVSGDGKMKTNFNKSESELMKINIKITNSKTVSLQIARYDEFNYRQTGILLREKLENYKLNTDFTEEKALELASYSFAKKVTSNIHSEAYKLYKKVYSQYLTNITPEKLNLVVAFHLAHNFNMVGLQNINQY